MKKRILGIILSFFVVSSLTLSVCAKEADTDKSDKKATEESAEELEELEMAGGKAGGKTSPDAGADTAPPELPGLTYVSAMDTAYAEAFDIYTYRAEDSGAEYRLIDVHNSGQYLLLPQQDADQNAVKKVTCADKQKLQRQFVPIDQLFKETVKKPDVHIDQRIKADKIAAKHIH